MQQDELSRLIPATRTVGDVEIKPIFVKDLPRLIQSIEALLPLMESKTPVTEIIRLHFPEVVEVVSAASDRKPDWVMGLTLAQMLDLLEAVKDMNADFFLHRLLRMMNREYLVQALNQALTIVTDGSEASNGSSTETTASTT